MKPSLPNLLVPRSRRSPGWHAPSKENRIMNERTQRLIESKPDTIFGISGIPATDSKQKRYLYKPSDLLIRGYLARFCNAIFGAVTPKAA